MTAVLSVGGESGMDGCWCTLINLFLDWASCEYSSVDVHNLTSTDVAMLHGNISGHLASRPGLTLHPRPLCVLLFSSLVSRARALLIGKDTQLRGIGPLATMQSHQPDLVLHPISHICLLPSCNAPHLLRRTTRITLDTFTELCRYAQRIHCSYTRLFCGLCESTADRILVTALTQPLSLHRSQVLQSFDVLLMQRIVLCTLPCPSGRSLVGEYMGTADKGTRPGRSDPVNAIFAVRLEYRL